MSNIMMTRWEGETGTRSLTLSFLLRRKTRSSHSYSWSFLHGNRSPPVRPSVRIKGNLSSELGPFLESPGVVDELRWSFRTWGCAGFGSM